MKNAGFIVLDFLILNSCTTSKKVARDPSLTSKPGTEIRDGASFEKAIILLVKTETVGVHAEYEWIGVHYPGYKRGMQSLSTYKKKPFDIISITTAEGKELDIYFDISNFYGKF